MDEKWKDLKAHTERGDQNKDGEQSSLSSCLEPLVDM